MFHLPQTLAFFSPPTRKPAARPGSLPKASWWAPTTKHLAPGFWSVCSATTPGWCMAEVCSCLWQSYPVAVLMAPSLC